MNGDKNEVRNESGSTKNVGLLIGSMVVVVLIATCVYVHIDGGPARAAAKAVQQTSPTVTNVVAEAGAPLSIKRGADVNVVVVSKSEERTVNPRTEDDLKKMGLSMGNSVKISVQKKTVVEK